MKVRLSLNSHLLPPCSQILTVQVSFLFVCFLSPWHKLELSGKSQLRRCLHHIGLSSICYAFSWLIIHVERPSPLLVMPPQAGDPDCIKEKKKSSWARHGKEDQTVKCFPLCFLPPFLFKFLSWLLSTMNCHQSMETNYTVSFSSFLVSVL